MERERWLQMYRAACELDKGSCRGMFRAAVIVGVFLWAVLHDRPVSWACLRKNWPPDLVRYRLPSQSTMSRRLRDRRVQSLLRAIEHSLPDDATASVKTIDAKPLPIGGYSHDRDAAKGRGVRAIAWGYKLYAVWAGGVRPIAWRIAAMPVSEQAMALEMLPELVGTGYLVGDCLYDINKIYEAAAAVGHQLLAPRKRPEAGVSKKKLSPHRVRGIQLMATAVGRALYERRTHIERQFSGLTCSSGGLGPLPAWVRRRRRVELWVQAKLIINAYRLQKLRNKPTPAIA